MKKLLPLFLILLLALSIAGCEGGTSGSVSGSSQSCSTDSSGGTCQGKFSKLSGTFSEDIPMSYAASAVQVEVTASVDEGSVRVYLIDPDGEHVGNKIAKPNAPVTVSGLAEGYTDTFRVYFEAVDGSAKGVRYNLTYAFP